MAMTSSLLQTHVPPLCFQNPHLYLEEPNPTAAPLPLLPAGAAGSKQGAAGRADSVPKPRRM